MALYNAKWNTGMDMVFNNIAPPREFCAVCGCKRVVTKKDGTKWCLYCRAVVDTDISVSELKHTPRRE